MLQDRVISHRIDDDLQGIGNRADFDSCSLSAKFLCPCIPFSSQELVENELH